MEKLTIFDKGIYLEFAPAPTSEPFPGGRDDLLHSYIVYRDSKGGERVIRGGPSAKDNKLDHARFGPLGKIEVQAGIPLSQSKDAYKPGETPKDRHATKLDIGDVQGYWKLMSEHSCYAKLAGEVASGPNTSPSASVSS